MNMAGHEQIISFCNSLVEIQFRCSFLTPMFYDCFRIAACPKALFEFHKALLKCCF